MLQLLLGFWLQEMTPQSMSLLLWSAAVLQVRTHSPGMEMDEIGDAPRGNLGSLALKSMRLD